MKNLLSILAIGTAFITGGCSSDPIETFNEAIKQADSQNWTQAVKLAKFAAENNPTELTQSFYAVCLIKSAKDEDASAILEQLALENPKQAVLQYLCGKSLFDAGKTNKSYTFLQKSYQLDNSNDNCLILLFQCCVILKKTETPSYYTKIKSKNAVIMNNYGVWLHNQKSPKDYPTFLIASKKDPKNAEIVLNKAITHDQKKRLEHALNTYKDYLRLSKDKPDGHLDVSTRMNTITEHLNSQ